MENQPGKTPDPGKPTGEQVIEIGGQKLTPAQVRETLKAQENARTIKAIMSERAQKSRTESR